MNAEKIRPNIPKLDIHAVKDESERSLGTLVPLHYHDELELIPIYRGSLLCRAQECEYVAEAGDIVFVNSRIPHETYVLDEKTVYSLIQFKEDSFIDNEIMKIIKYSVKLHALESAPVRILRSEELLKTINLLLKECSEKSTAYEIMARSYILKIIGILYREGILSDSEKIFSTAQIQKILPILIHINKNYREELTLDKASALLGFDKSYFCRIFKSAVGVTFTEYLNFVRVCKAEKLLSTTSLNVTEICEEVGFNSVSYFNRTFKAFKSCTPSKYRTAKYLKHI